MNIGYPETELGRRAKPTLTTTYVPAISLLDIICATLPISNARQFNHKSHRLNEDEGFRFQSDGFICPVVARHFVVRLNSQMDQINVTQKVAKHFQNSSFGVNLLNYVNKFQREIG